MVCKKIISFSFFILALVTLKGQKGNNILCINGQAAILSELNQFGGGIDIKGLYGISKTAQLTASIGFALFNSKSSMNLENGTIRFIPFFIGYRQNIKSFFVEPEGGIGELGGKIDIGGDFSRTSIAAIFGAVGIGYNIKKLILGVRFQSAHGMENSSVGIWHDKTFYYTSVFIGYSIISRQKH